MAEEEVPSEAPEESQVSTAPVEDSAPVEAVAEAPVEQEAQQPEGSVWDAFKQIPDFQGQDETAIAQRLYAALQAEQQSRQAISRYEEMLPVTREYLSNRDNYRQWQQLQAQQQQPQPQPQMPTVEEPEQPKWWNPPQVRDSYKRYLVRDENGREVISEDAPLEAKHELFEYQQYKAEFAQKFLADPQEALGPMVEQIALQKAQEIVNNQFKDYGEQQYVSSLEQQNRDWLFDDSGAPTKEGLAVQKYIAKAAELGIQSPDARWEYATDQLERDLLNEIRENEQRKQRDGAFNSALEPYRPQQETEQQNAPEPAQNRAERDIEYLRREASRNPSRASASPDPRIPQGPQSFQDRLAQQLARSGLT